MVQISALDYCFLSFPQFRNDFDILKEINVLYHKDNDNCEWLFSELSLLEYFNNIGSIAEKAYDTSISKWLPVETLFGLKSGSLAETGKKNNLDILSDDYKTIRTKLKNYRNARIEISKWATDLNCYRTIITNTIIQDLQNATISLSDKPGITNNSHQNEKPTLIDYLVIYDFCLRLFESTWNSIFHEFGYDILDEYFGELAINVYLRKREELLEILIECVEKEFPDIDFHVKLFEIEKKILSKVEDLNENKLKPDYIPYLDVNEAATYLHITPESLYNLVYKQKITSYKPGGKKLLFKIQDLEKYTFRNKKTNANELSDDADAILMTNQNKRKK